MATVPTGYTLHTQAANSQPNPRPRYAPDAEYSTIPEVVPQVPPYEQHVKYPIEAQSVELSAVRPNQESSKKSTILGLQKKTFILSMLLAVIVVIAAVGGGVGGFLVVKRAKG
jgi:hypothetical protein